MIIKTDLPVEGPPLTIGEPKPDGGVLRGLKGRALRCHGHAQVQVLLVVPDKAAELLLLARLLGVDDGKVVVGTYVPVPQT